ncbi:hypothetical protein [Bacillus sp. AP8]|nr:hypothetical protein [Bacillus sp. AP8]
MGRGWLLIIELFGIDSNVRKVKNQNVEIIELLKQLDNLSLPLAF